MADTWGSATNGWIEIAETVYQFIYCLLPRDYLEIIFYMGPRRTNVTCVILKLMSLIGKMTHGTRNCKKG
jgi:hypothetical protein